MIPLSRDDPTVIGPYQLLQVLGEGGMGRVYLARSPGFRLVALKVIHREYAKDPGFRERFRREVTAARSVSEFCTTPVIDAAVDAEQPWLATSYFPAPSLEEFVDRFGPMKEPELRALGAGLAEALSAIHQAGLVHRDLHPANVLLAREGPQIIDFGISKAQDTTRVTRTGAMIGTPGYMSPEQIVRERSSEPAAATRESRVRQPSDLFSLGCVLAFAATGSDPFGPGNARARLRRAVHEEPVLECLPGSLRPVVAACLDKDPARRPGVADLLDKLSPVDPQALRTLRLQGELDERERRADLIGRGPVHQPPEENQRDIPGENGTTGNGVRPPHFPPRPRGRARLAWILAGAVSLLTVGGILVAYALSGPDSGSGKSDTPSTKPNSPWSLTVSQADILRGMWSTSSRVVLGSPSGLTAYDPDTGARLWSWKPPGNNGILCNMSHTTSDGIGAITYGTFDNTVGMEECDRLQTISASSGKLNWAKEISLKGRGSTGLPNLTGGESLSIGHGMVSAPFAGGTDLLSAAVDTGNVRWSTGPAEPGINATVDGCSLSGLAQVLKGTVYALGQCGDGQGELLAFREGSTPSVTRVAALEGCARVSSATISGFMTANGDYLLIGCGSGSPAPRVYTLAAGSRTPSAVDLTGVAAGGIGALYKGGTPPVNVLMADSTLYLLKGQNSFLGGTQDGVVAVDMATGRQRWARTMTGASSVRLLAATGSDVSVLARGAGPPALYSLAAANGDAAKKYVLNTSQADTFNNPYASQTPYAVATRSHLAIGIPWALKPDQTVLVVLPVAPSVNVP